MREGGTGWRVGVLDWAFPTSRARASRSNGSGANCCGIYRDMAGSFLQADADYLSFVA